MESLVRDRVITSGETLARVLPQITSEMRAAGIADPGLRQLHAAIYQAFRRRRSLLLLNLESQVRIEELPWVAAIDRFRQKDISARELARRTLEETIALTVTSFPQAIIPNKLLQELRALAVASGLEIPLVDELAADIFMGQFSGKFIAATKRTAELLETTLYARYYNIKYADYRALPEVKTRSSRPDAFALMCATRAGAALGSWDPATNGMVIEQQQILTTQNLAVLFLALNLNRTLQPYLEDMARRCFSWICRRQQMKTGLWHARLIMVKNTAYAWRQMVFFLSLLPEAKLSDFLKWSEMTLGEQPEEFQKRFFPVFRGLSLAANGLFLDEVTAAREDARCFVGWSKQKHWMLS